MTNQLIALLDGREVGTVNYKNARLSFLYSARASRCAGERGPSGSDLEKNSGYLLSHEIRFLASHLVRHRWIVLDAGADAHEESLISHPAHHALGVLLCPGRDAAHYGLVAYGWEGRRLRPALREIGGELFGDVGHDVDRYAQPANHRSLRSREFADSVASIADLGSHRHGAAENPAGGGFVDPGTLRLPVANGRYKHRQAEQDSARASHVFSAADSGCENSFTTLRFPPVAKAVLHSWRLIGAAEKRALF